MTVGAVRVLNLHNGQVQAETEICVVRVRRSVFVYHLLRVGSRVDYSKLPMAITLGA